MLLGQGGGAAAQQHRPTGAQASIHKIVVSVKGGGIKAESNAAQKKLI